MADHRNKSTAEDTLHIQGQPEEVINLSDPPAVAISARSKVLIPVAGNGMHWFNMGRHMR